jgi:hypothetical protein
MATTKKIVEPIAAAHQPAPTVEVAGRVTVRARGVS